MRQDLDKPKEESSIVEPGIEVAQSDENDVLKIGDIYLSSRYFLVPDLISFAKEILQDKTFKDYLKLFEVKNNACGYLG